MNSTQAKQLSLPDIMARLGYEPTSIKKGGQEYWYHSPFRREKDASFHTSYLGGKWIWNDFADKGGTVIDFVMRHENFTQVSQSLQFLERMFQGHLFEKPPTKKIRPGKNITHLFSFQQQKPQEEVKPPKELEFIKATPIKNPLIYTYLKGRGIPKGIVDRYVKEVRYRNIKNDKNYFGFGMENESGGFEVRAATNSYSFKTALKQRDITFIAGTSSQSSSVNVFEGMTDFLSLLVMLGADQLKGDALIMHSLSSFQRSAEAITEKGYSTINTFLDNDKSGQETTGKFSELFGEKVKSQSDSFGLHRDLNDALRANMAKDSPSR